MEALDDLCLGSVCGFLSAQDLLSLSSACSRLRSFCTQRWLWKRHLWELYGHAADSDEADLFRVFVQQRRLFGRYEHCGFGALRRAVDAIRARFVAAGLRDMFLPGATEEEISAFEQRHECVFPEELRATLRIANGQRPPSAMKDAMLGCASFYDMRIVCVPVGLQLLENLWVAPFQHTPPCIFLLGSSKWVGVIDRQKRVVMLPHRENEGFKLANSWTEYLVNLANNMTDGIISVQPSRGAWLFPQRICPRAVTYGIEVTCSPLFVPTLSTPGLRYVFAYHITMRGVQGCRKGTLASRHWIIENGDDVEHVRGPGVIGLHPFMEEGCETFAYESMCNLTSLTGAMSGTFTFADENGEYEIVVPRFVLDARPYLL